MIKIKAQGLKLFHEPLEIDFYARQRVTEEDESVVPLFSYRGLNLSTHNVIAFSGLNASGKTMVLNTILMVLNLLNGNYMEFGEEILNLFEGNNPVELNILFEENHDLYCLYSVIQVLTSNGRRSLAIIDEKLYRKHLKDIKSKKEIDKVTWTEEALLYDRNSEELKVFPNMTSIMYVYHLNHPAKIDYCEDDRSDEIDEILQAENPMLPEILNYLDPSIEYLKIRNLKDARSDIRLKFVNDKNEIKLDRAEQLEFYLSSGTIKGINLLSGIFRVLENGGYVIVDEIENHFNREIVAAVIRMFMNRTWNRSGAVLLFTTHYPELLDRFERNDDIYITRHGEKGITVSPMSEELKRNDLKRSEVLRSDYLGGTAPSYDAYMNMRKKFISLADEAASNGGQK